MTEEREESLRNAISYCIENFDVNKATSRLIEFIKDEKAINYSQCCETLKDENDEISDLAKNFISEVDKKHPFVNLPEEEDFYMARHKLAEKLT